MDLAIIIILIIVVVIIFKDVKFVTYALGIMEIFFQIMHWIGDNLGIKEFNSFINNYIPSSTFNILAKYTSGVIYIILSWILLITFVFFLIYLVNYLIRRK